MKTALRNIMLAWLITGSTAITMASAPPPHDLSLLVIPERLNMVQAGFELNQLRPLALVTYRTRRPTGEVILHGWTGQEWIPVSLSDYATGDFMVRNPVRIILVGDEALLPGELVEASNWGPLVLNVEATRTDEFFNAMGSLFDFSSREWRQIAQRHNMAIEDVTPEAARVSWYDQATAARQQPERRRAPTPERRTPPPTRPEPAPAPMPEIVPEPEPAPMPPVTEPDEQPAPTPAPPPRIAPEAIWEPVELGPDESTADDTIK